ncbi:hypothetical protein VHUM_03296 [Vanrija humicola]|uniref:Uncharacterized protein n=1 Tax=Vanrija humicola TaxID=5417 RepID=A0A7D8Z6W2_VANHU|nr:hypothetical protein VHUM_03296 [Vanrija humicola]
MFATLLTTFLAVQAAVAAPVNIQKRFSGRATYYEVGLGACGHTNSGSEFVVALNAPQYSGGAYCGQSVTISANGKSTQATVVDLCPGCPYGALDLSESLFTYFNPTSVGVFTIDWSFGGGGGGGGGGGDSQPSPSPSPSPDPPAPTSSAAPPPPPPEPSTSSAAPPPPQSSTTTTDAASSSTTTSLVASSSTSSAPASSVTSLSASSVSLNSTALAAPTVSLNSTSISSSTPDAAVINHDGDASGNLAAVNNLVASLGRLAVIAAGQ